MKTIIFVCHGNICRSPAAEFIFKKLLKENDLENEYLVYSRALSYEEIGNDIYSPMKEELRYNHIPFTYHEAQILSEKEVKEADVIFYMDESNRRIIEYMFKDYLDKFKPIFIYTSSINKIEDPWYTRRFNLVVKQLEECLKDMIKNI